MHFRSNQVFPNFCTEIFPQLGGIISVKNSKRMMLLLLLVSVKMCVGVGVGVGFVVLWCGLSLLFANRFRNF